MSLFSGTCYVCPSLSLLSFVTIHLIALLTGEGRTGSHVHPPTQVVGGWLPHERGQRMVARPKVTKGIRGSRLTCDWGAQMANTTLFPTRLFMPRLVCCAKSRTRDAWTLTNAIRCLWRSFNEARINLGQGATCGLEQGKLWESGLPVLWSPIFYPYSMYSSIHIEVCSWEVGNGPDSLCVCVCLFGHWDGLLPALRSAIEVQQ